MHMVIDQSVQNKVFKETLKDKFVQKKIFGKRLHPLCALVNFLIHCVRLVIF